ncbi:hypothetical protein FLBR109950_01825 [Flavobacterium branchiophilum]|uniref:Lipoprotein n=1 Tax=Flavobacterium branchiophilum (strain FL-15) TaxID=1034807 RepID=G2Z638_FLABF|nr:hypothetical protein [Flavobacterium branchiophilum]CCB68806.1 Hypothetical protein precursor [Flavobacterium branchiophilum FL-15]
MKSIFKIMLLLVAISSVQISNAQDAPAPKNAMKYKKDLSKVYIEKIARPSAIHNLSCILLDMPNKDITQNETEHYVCGIAYGRSGGFAVSYIHKIDNGKQIGKVKIWEKFGDFYNGNQPNKTHFVYNPEAIAFDADQNLYVSSTVDNKIVYFMKSDNWNTQNAFMVMANKVNPTSLSNPWNARGINFDENNDLYIMCENLHCNECTSNQVFPASVVKVTQPTSASRTMTEIQGSSQEKEQALGVAVGDGKMFTTDLHSKKINMYNLNGTTATLSKTLNINFTPLDIIYVKSEQAVYFTCVENSVSKVKKWNFNTSNTAEEVKTISSNAVYPSSWGLAYVCDKLIVADGVNSKVVFFKR